MKTVFAGALALLLAAPGALAQNFTSAGEVKPILELTKGSWIAVREYNGQDLLYFTHLSRFRCGLTEIWYGVNTDEPTQRFDAEPCYRDEAAPNALKMENGQLPFVPFPQGSVHFVTVRIVYDDNSEATQNYPRAAVLMP